jgi:hypothetical protein
VQYVTVARKNGQDGPVEDVSTRPEVRAAAKRVRRQARRAVRAWVTALVTVTTTTLLACGVTVMFALDVSSMRSYTLIWGIFTVALAYNVTRFYPRRQHETWGVALSPEDAQVLGDWMAHEIDGWRPPVRLVPSVTLFMDQQTLVLGLPLVLCLRERELATLLRDVREVSTPNTWPPVARALILDAGGLGRGLEERTGWDTWISRRLLNTISSRISSAYEAQLELAQELRSGRDQAWHDAIDYADFVWEAWSLLTHKWLTPASRQRVWHAEPSAGLRSFVTACEQQGLFVESAARPADPDVVTVLPELLRYDRDMAELLASDEPHDNDPTPWAGHPEAVSVPEWRATVAEGLEAARQATGTPHEASVDSILQLVAQGWGDSIASVLTPAEYRDSEPPTEAVIRSLLEAAAALTLVDAGCATPIWEWPHGTVLRDRDGAPLSLFDASADHTRLQAWLRDLGGDSSLPLWLGNNRPPPREDALGAFLGYRRLRSYHVVVSPLFVRLFRRSLVSATRERTRMLMSGTEGILGGRMDAVSNSDLRDQEDSIALSEVVRATFAPRIGGHWWVLKMRTADRTFSVRGDGDGREIESWFAGVLKDRLQTRWLHSPRPVKWLRDVYGFLCLGLAGLAVVMAMIFAVTPPEDSGRASALAMLAAGALFLALGLVPDLLNSIVQRARRDRRRTAHGQRV